jgi:hypothetical protein
MGPNVTDMSEKFAETVVRTRMLIERVEDPTAVTKHKAALLLSG